MAAELLESIRVPAYEGRSFTLSEGQCLVVIDVEGRQIGDLVVLSAADPTERLSTSMTRLRAGRLRIGLGDRLYSTLDRPLAAIVAEDNGEHDAVSHPCDSARYEIDFKSIGHPNCRDNLLAALAEWGVDTSWLPDPFNVFMRTVFAPDGRYWTDVATSRPGDRFLLRAETDLVGAISACPQDMFPANGYRITDLQLDIWSAVPADPQ